MARQYQAEFDDDSVLTFTTTTQRDALGIITDHAQPDHEFTLKSRKDKEPLTAWGDISKSSYWKVNYPGYPANCKRVR